MITLNAINISVVIVLVYIIFFVEYNIFWKHVFYFIVKYYIGIFFILFVFSLKNRFNINKNIM